METVILTNRKIDQITTVFCVFMDKWGVVPTELELKLFDWAIKDIMCNDNLDEDCNSSIVEYAKGNKPQTV